MNMLKFPGGGEEELSKYLRKQGMTVGVGTKTASQLKTAEPYLITIGDNVIVGAGSVVTKSVSENNVLVAGNPAKVIGTWKNFENKVSKNVIHAGYLSADEKRKRVLNSENLVNK